MNFTVTLSLLTKLSLLLWKIKIITTMPSLLLKLPCAPKETFVAIKNWLSKACRISNTYVKG
jgi:hypothetical protein